MISERGRGARAVFRFAEYGVAAASPPARFAAQTARVRPAPTVSPKCAKAKEKALSPLCGVEPHEKYRKVNKSREKRYVFLRQRLSIPPFPLPHRKTPLSV